MRKNLFAIMALLVCAFVACNKNEIEITTEPAGTVEMTVVASDATTKTAYSGESIVWGASEKISVIQSVTGGESAGYTYTASNNGTPSEGKMTFGVSLEAIGDATSFQYASIYPSTCINKVTSFANIAVNTPSEQTPTTTSYDPAADLLISHVGESVATQPSSINVAFARKIAFAQMTVKNLPSSEEVTKVSFSAKTYDAVGAKFDDVTIAGRSKVNMTESTIDYGSNIKTKVINMNYEGKGLTANTTMLANFAAYPFSLTTGDKFTVVVETATKIYTREVTLAAAQSLVLTAGDVARFSVNMSGVEPVSKAVDLVYAEFTDKDVYDNVVTNNTYTTFNFTKTHDDKWLGKTNYTTNGFGLRDASGTNDGYVKLPDFKDEINSITVVLGQALTVAEPAKFLSLETVATAKTKTIMGIDAVADQLTYVFDLSALEPGIKTAYLRAVNSNAYVKKVIVMTKKTDTRATLAAPTDVTAVLNGTNDIDVSWTKAANAIGYEITCTPTSGPAVVNTVGDVSSYKVESLPNNTTFTVSVASVPDYYVNKKSAAQSASSTVTTKAGVTYTKYTGALVAGDYVLVGSTDHAMKNSISSDRTTYETVTISDDKIINPSSSIVWTITQSGEYWTIYNAAVDKFIAGIQDTKNKAALIKPATDYALWSAAVSSETWAFTNKGRAADTTDNANKYLRSNGNSGFAVYGSSTGTKITLYKKD